MKKITIISFLLISASVLGGCSSSKGLDCPVGKGMQCKSISQVNQAVNEGKLEDSAITATKYVPAKLNYSETHTDKFQKKFQKQIERIPEQTMRVWLGGFADDSGDYVEETYAHIVTEPGKWQEIN